MSSGLCDLKSPPETDGEFTSKISSVCFTPLEGVKSDDFKIFDMNGFVLSSSLTSE